MACPVCESQRAERLWRVRDRVFRVTDREFELARCRDCAIVYLWPRPSRKELSAFYPTGYWSAAATPRGPRASLTEIYRRLVLRDHLRFVSRVIDDQRARGEPVRLLDVGAGDGAFAAALDCSGSVAMDASPQAVRAARARGLEAVVGELDPPAWRPGSFSLLTLFHVLEHVPEPCAALAAARVLLRPGGDLVVQVPNLDSWQARLLGRRWMGWEVPRHVVNFSAATLRATLERAGFEVVRESHFSLRDNANTLVNSLWPGLFPPARAARGVGHRGIVGWAGDLAYLGLTLCALPFTLLESACGRGAAVMVQARVRA